MSAAARPYFHGTVLRAAVEALLDGSPLSQMRPAGRSGYARSAQGRVYLTPSFTQAANYAFMRSRSDWPGDLAIPLAATGHVFSFDLSADATLRAEEDELGWAVMKALSHESHPSGLTPMNFEFATAFLGDPEAMGQLAEAARSSGAFRPADLDPAAVRHWSGRQRTAAGNRMSKAIGPDLEARIVGLGCSVSTALPHEPTGGWSLPRLVFEPGQADAVPGPWDSGGPSA